MNIQQFIFSQHPYLLPNFMNLFSWSIPFLCEKVTEMLLHLSRPKKNETPESAEEVKAAIPKSNMLTLIIESEVLRSKVKSISRMIKLFKMLREQNEDVLKLKGLCPDNKLPRGVLLEGSSGIKDAIQQFGKMKKADLQNEKRPGTTNKK